MSSFAIWVPAETKRRQAKAAEARRDAKVAKAARELDDAAFGSTFDAFDYANPGVYRWFEDTALATLRQYGRVSMRYLYERARIERPVTIDGTDDEFLLNKNIIACYARALIVANPFLANHLELRPIPLQGGNEDDET